MSGRAILVAWVAAILLVLASRAAWRGAAEAVASGAASAGVHEVPIRVDEVDRVVVERRDADGTGRLRFVFERDDEGWAQVEPFEVAAEGFAIRQLAVAAADLLAWQDAHRDAEGAYWMGWQFEEAILWPEERPSWTQAAAILAHDALFEWSPAARVLTQHL